MIPGWDGTPIAVRRSRVSGVLYTERWQDNVLAPPGGQDWPPSLLREVRSFRARADWFTPDDAAALAAQLGFISKMQSLRSEDGITWSWFGTLACEPPDKRGDAVQWLYDRLQLDLVASTDPMIDQWMRVFHPNKPKSQNGPHLDARIDDPDVALMYVEAKWDAAIGTGKGAAEGDRDNQIVLRRGSLRKDPTLANDRRSLLVVGVSRVLPDPSVYDETDVAWLTWDDLAACSVHPRAEDFGRYLGVEARILLASHVITLSLTAGPAASQYPHGRDADGRDRVRKLLPCGPGGRGEGRWLALLERRRRRAPPVCPACAAREFAPDTPATRDV